MDLHLLDRRQSTDQAPTIADRYLAQPGGKGADVARAAARLGTDWPELAVRELLDVGATRVVIKAAETGALFAYEVGLLQIPMARIDGPVIQSPQR